jgi:predicted transcriptional regulator of viral defense system
MARTIFPSAVLNRAQLEFLEQIIARCGTIVTYAQISPHIPVQDELGKRQFVSRLSQAGRLVRIKKGVYQVADLASLGTVTLARYAVAHILAPDSYVSFEAALQFHGLHDQLMQTMASVALKQHQSVVVQDYLPRANLTTQRIFGFWFDRLGMTVDPDLAQRTRSGQAASRLTAGSTTYDPKWRLYYDNSIVDRYVPA